jgi:hypothetical protein
VGSGQSGYPVAVNSPQIIQASAGDIDRIVPLFLGYREFYKQVREGICQGRYTLSLDEIPTP